MAVTSSRPGRADAAWLLLAAAWLVALVATAGALFVGEVMGQAPCVLCWYQRIFMFPLAILLAIACLRSDTALWRYALALAVPGGLIAAYHTGQYFDLISTPIQPCGQQGPSCSGAEMTVLGGVPLPLLSLIAFALIAILLLLQRRYSK